MPNDKPFRRWSPEMMVGVSAVFIGLCALFVSMYEARLMREETRAEVLPIIELSRSFYVTSESDEQPHLSLDAHNVGIGPARIRDFRVTVRGESQPTWRAAMAALIGEDQQVRFGQSSINGRTIPPDRTVTMFNLASSEHAHIIIDAFEYLDFEACYCSVFDECWQTSFGASEGPRPVPHCKRDSASFTE